MANMAMATMESLYETTIE